MKYGNTLKENIESEYSKYYIPYNSMKKNVYLEKTFFLLILNRYCEITEDFYLKNKYEKELTSFCLFNVFSIMKITKKYNKKNNCKITNKVSQILCEKYFYKDLINEELLLKNKKCNEPCIICYDRGNYTLKLDCCKKSICWNCSLKYYANGSNRCSYCRNFMNTNPIIIALNNITETTNPFYNHILCENKEQKKLLVIGLDGLRPDALLYANTPNLDYLIQNGVYNFETIVECDTISGPSWTSIMTGKTQYETGVDCNETVEDDKYVCKEDIFTILNSNNVTTTCYLSNWIGLKNIVKNSKNIEYKDNENVLENDSKMIECCERYISSTNNDDKFTFLYLNGIDDTGHNYGFTIQSKEYISYIEAIDRKLENIIKKVIENKWSLLITTDHGGCKKTDLEPNRINIFDTIFFVSGQVKKECVGIHGLDIPQHTRTFKLLYGDIVENNKRELLGNIKSQNTFHDIINYFIKQKVDYHFLFKKI